MQSKCKAMQSKFTRLVFVLILSNCLIINKTVVSFRYAVFMCGINYYTPIKQKRGCVKTRFQLKTAIIL